MVGPAPDTTAAFRRWPWYRRWFGERSERYAAKYLSRNGLQIIARNVSDLRGELDLIALSHDSLIIIEVRSTSTPDLHRAASSVDFTKQRKITAAAFRFLSRRRLWNINVRYDILALSWPPHARTPEVLHLPGAFQPADRFQMFS